MRILRLRLEAMLPLPPRFLPLLFPVLLPHLPVVDVSEVVLACGVGLLKALNDRPDHRWSECDVKALGLDPSTARRAFKRQFGLQPIEHRKLSLTNVSTTPE